MHRAGAPPHRRADGAQRGGELADIVVRRDIARLEMDLGDAAVVAGGQAIKDFRQPLPRTAINPAHDAKIQRDNVTVFSDLQVALVHVRVKEPVAQGMA